jgi:hypothetical protein
VGGVRVPGGDYDAYVESHVRRLEALRHAGIVERIDADRWLIPDGFEARAQAYDAGQGRRASVRVLSPYDLDRQVTSHGATWLDRQLVNRDQGTLAEAGFGAEVRGALERRKDELIRQGHAWRIPGEACGRDATFCTHSNAGRSRGLDRGLPRNEVSPSRRSRTDRPYAAS